MLIQVLSLNKGHLYTRDKVLCPVVSVIERFYCSMQAMWLPCKRCGHNAIYLYACSFPQTTMSAVKDTEVVSHGVATITRGLSVHDYFAQKLSTNRTTSNRTEDKMSNANPQSCDSAYRSCDFLTRSCDSTSSPCDSSLRSCDTELLYSSPNNQLPMDKSARLIDDAVTMDTKLVARRKGRKKRKKMTGHEGHSLASSYCYV